MLASNGLLAKKKMYKLYCRFYNRFGRIGGKKAIARYKSIVFKPLLVITTLPT